MIQGVILVGGASSRMGRSKAAFARGGRSQTAFLAERLAEGLGGAAWVLGRGRHEAGSLRRIADREPGAGPLSALLGLFDREPRGTYLVLACDYFAMTPAALQWLAGQARCFSQPAVWPLLPGRTFGEPLAALYRPEAAPLLEASWRAGNRAIRRALPEDARAQPAVPDEHLGAFLSANTPDELARIKLND